RRAVTRVCRSRWVCPEMGPAARDAPADPPVVREAAVRTGAALRVRARPRQSELRPFAVPATAAPARGGVAPDVQGRSHGPDRKARDVRAGRAEPERPLGRRHGRTGPVAPDQPARAERTVGQTPCESAGL